MEIETESVTANEASGYFEGGNGPAQNPTQFLDSDYDVFRSLLLEWGFTVNQLFLINDALRESGLEFSRIPIGSAC